MLLVSSTVAGKIPASNTGNDVADSTWTSFASFDRHAGAVATASGVLLTVAALCSDCVMVSDDALESVSESDSEASDESVSIA